MTNYEEEFLKGIINDIDDAEDYHDILEEMMKKYHLLKETLMVQ